MAQVSIKEFDWNKDYYAFVCIGGYECYYGRFRAWKLYSLTSDSVKILSQSPNEVKAMFDTQEELEAYIANLHKEPVNKEAPTLSDNVQDDVKLNTIGSGKDKLVISRIL